MDKITKYEILQQLSWQIEAGADESVENTPQNRLESNSQNTIPTADKHFKIITNNKKNENNIVRSNSPKPYSEDLTHGEISPTYNSIQELSSAIRKFDGCSLSRTATNTVVYDGDPQAKLMIIGEAPGAEEDRSGLPFVGPAGQLLNKMLAAINIQRQDCYITNIIFWRPPGNRAPTPDEIEICKPFVYRQIELVKPKIIVLAGGISAKGMLNRTEGITRLRGKWQQITTPVLTKPISAIATFHPAYLLRQPQAKREAWNDLQCIREKLDEDQ
tara:strand:+ start:9245 stop:10063 length:819 start_codon:yes stop_codon:yes gene_type:complete